MGMWHDLALFIDGNLQLAGHNPGSTLMPLRSARESLTARNARIFRPFLDAECARKLAALGKVEEAREFVTAARAVMGASNEHWSEAEVYRIDGVVHLAERHPEEAEKAYLKAIEVAQRQHAKSWELRAATSLAKLWGEQSERRKALGLLSPIHAWFTEGLDTPDLRDASRLLDELS